MTIHRSRVTGLPLAAIAAIALFSLSTGSALAAITTIIPALDNTVAEELPDNSSGACDSIFSGNTDNYDPGNSIFTARRALMQFDIAGAVPPGSIINSVTLSMTVTRGSNHVDSTYTLHPVTGAWTEGVDGCGPRGGGQGEPSTGGVTWNTMPAFGSASGSTLVNNTAPSWGDAALAGDVQSWLDNPAANFGWILIGDETIKTTARRFDSREGASPPELLIDFTPTGDVEACCETGGDCSLTVVGSGTCGGTVQTGVSSCDPNPCPQPTGACCNADNTCDDSIDKLVCEGAGGSFVGGNCNQADCGLEPFVEPLPIPPVLQPTGTSSNGDPQYTISVEAATQSVHPDLPDTDLWTYNGAWPSATIVAQKYQPIEVIYQNNLPSGGGGRGSSLLEIDTCAHGPNYFGDAKRIVTHLHGGHLPARFDGQPEFTLLPGESDVYQYPNNQAAGTLWYHDHALGITRLNVYGGMAGFYLLADDEDTLGPGNAFGFPSGQYEIGLAIQDRTFDADGSLFYNAQLEDAFKGDTIVVNGKVAPFLDVDQGKYRFRILNGSQSREYSYRLENTTNPGNDPSFLLVGTDLGLLDAPVDLGNAIGGTVAPAERLDVIIDFAGIAQGDEIILRNDDPTLPLLPSIMKFVVTGNPGYTGAVAPVLRTVTPLPDGSEDATRYFRLKKDAGAACKDGSGRFVNEWLVESLDGPGGNVIGKYWDDLTDFPRLGQREIWEFENPTSVMHPMHVHLVKFQILGKTDLTTGQPIPLEPWEANAWKDIVRIPANASARIIMDFEDYPGRFPQHCHILDHEDHEMMRQFQAINDPAYCNNDGVCDPAEDCISCPNDCGQVSGALCGNGLCEGGDGENCANCPADCGGKQTGSASKQFCCGFDDGQVTNPVGCGVDAADDRCIDAGSGLACRVEARVSACCGDALCEGQEEVQGNNPDTYCQLDCDANSCFPTEPVVEYTCNDGQDNDCDTLVDGNDPDCFDTDGDGLTDAYETNILGTLFDDVDTDNDGLVDGDDGIVSVAAYPQGVDVDGDGFVDGEQQYGTDPVDADSDGDQLDDGLEAANGADPNDAASYPYFKTGDIAPLGGAPDGQVNAGDVTIAFRYALGQLTPSPLQLAYGDMDMDDDIDALDALAIIELVLGL